MSNLKPTNKDTTYDRIFFSFQKPGSVVLTDAEEEQKKRYEAAFALLCNYHSTEQAVPLLVAKFEISRATAYRDIANAKNLFGNISKSNKDGQRNIYVEWETRRYQMALLQRPPDLENAGRAMANLIKLGGFDKDDNNMPNLEELMNGVYVTQLNIQVNNENKQVFLDMDKLHTFPPELIKLLQDSTRPQKELTLTDVDKMISDAGQDNTSV